MPDHSSRAQGRWFEAVADRLGRAYLRYSFTKGTAQEVAFLIAELGLAPSTLVLDAGCGPGRHTSALAHAGVPVVGADIAEPFLRIAAAGASDVEPGEVSPRFVRADVRAMPFRDAFDRAICLCQGGFGLLRGGDAAALVQLAACLRPGGLLALSAFSLPFARQNPPDRSSLDEASGVLHEHTTVRDEEGRDWPAELWTTCFDPDRLADLARAAGLVVRSLSSVAPGDYAHRPVTPELPELLLIGERRDPAGSWA